MATLAEVEAAFLKADQAGDTQAATALAGEVRRLRSAPAAKAAAPDESFPEKLGRQVLNAGAGAIRGAGSIGATILAPYDIAKDALDGKGLTLESNRQRRADMTAALGSMGADTDSLAFKGGQLGGEVAGTLGAGGAIANGAARIPGLATYAPNLLNSIRTSGMTAGAPQSAAQNVLLRGTGGGISGAGAAALVNPEEAAAGGAVGAALPGALQAAGKIGRGIGGVYRGTVAPSGANVLADALGLSQAEAAAMAQAAQAAPAEIVPGGRLTLAQALQKQGANTPGVKMLERTVAGGAGGDVLLQRYEQQAAARMEALRANGAQTYQGAAKEEATRQGDKIGAVLRTQAADDMQRTRQAWTALEGRALDDDVRLLLPLDEMRAAMGPLGPGSVAVGKDARAVLRTADDVGTVEVGGMKATRDAASSRPLTLAQAVRRAGGLSMQRNDGLRGEIVALGGDLKNIARTNGGLSPGRMAAKMHEAGYLPDEDAATLFAALRDDATGIPQISMYDDQSRQFMAARDAAMGAAPDAERAAVPVPFDVFQRLRRDSGALGAKAAEDAARGAEAKVLRDFEAVMSGRVDDAAAGNLRIDERMPAGFREDYNAVRGMTRRDKDLYAQGNNIGAILRKPVGQDYRLTGDEIFNKVWHGGAGLAGDVGNLKNALNQANFEPTMNALRQGIMTDAASRTTAAGVHGAALPRYVENRFPGLQEALTPDQLAAVSAVAGDIRNAEAAAAVIGLRGSDTQAKISRALDAGLIDAPLAKTLARVLSIKGVGAEWARAKIADAVAQNKAKAVAGLMADPAAAANALRHIGGAAPATGVNRLLSPAAVQAVYRAAPAIASGQ